MGFVEHIQKETSFYQLYYPRSCVSENSMGQRYIYGEISSSNDNVSRICVSCGRDRFARVLFLSVKPPGLRIKGSSFGVVAGSWSPDRDTLDRIACVPYGGVGRGNSRRSFAAGSVHVVLAAKSRRVTVRLAVS